MEIEAEKIPQTGIDEAASIARTILAKFDGTLTVANERKLAKMLDHTSKNTGAFRQKLVDLRTYELIDGHGDKELTRLGGDLVEEKERALMAIIEDTNIFAKAKRRFDVSTIDEESWNEFLDRQEPKDLDETNKNQLRKIYNSMARQIPDNGMIRQKSEKTAEPFLEEHFDKYYADLGKESKKDLCLDSLGRLAKRPIPSIEYYDKILALFEEDEPPEIEKRLLDILNNMCYVSTEDIRDERLDETVDLAMGFLDSSYPPRVRGNAIRILEVMDPREAEEARLGDLWVATKDFAQKGVEEDDDALEQDARQLFRLLVSEWADESLLKDMFEDTYDAYDTTTSGYGEFVGHWHETCQDALGMT